MELARAALLATEVAARLPEPRGRLYIDFIDRHLRGAAHELWRAGDMSAAGIQWRGEFALRHREEGREEGRAEQARVTLLQLCEARFGALPVWAEERIAHGSHEELTGWTLRIIDAGGIGDVFSPP